MKGRVGGACLQEADAGLDRGLQPAEAPPDAAKDDAALDVGSDAQPQRGLVARDLLPAPLEQHPQLQRQRRRLVLLRPSSRAGGDAAVAAAGRRCGCGFHVHLCRRAT